MPESVKVKRILPDNLVRVTAVITRGKLMALKEALRFYASPVAKDLLAMFEAKNET